MFKIIFNVKKLIHISWKNAVVKIFSLSGEELQTLDVSRKGKGSLEVSGGSFGAGTYTYQLILDGKTINTKIMVLTR